MTDIHQDHSDKDRSDRGLIELLMMRVDELERSVEALCATQAARTERLASEPGPITISAKRVLAMVLGQVD